MASTSSSLRADQSTNHKERKLEGKVAIISGGTSGIGTATALLFAKEGAKVGIHYSGLSQTSKEKAVDAANRVKQGGGDAIIVRADVSNPAEVRKAVEEVSSKFGSVNIAVCYAGLPASVESWHEDALSLSDEELMSPLKVDFLGSYHFIASCKDYMKKSGYGKIVLISSIPALYGEEAGYRYSLAKSLNIITTKSLSIRLIRDYGIHLNVIALGTVDTPANRRNYTDEQWSELVSAIPLGRGGKPEEIASVALFLSSHDSDYIVGQTIVADGGEFRH